MLKSDFNFDQELIRKISKEMAEEKTDEEITRHPELIQERERLQKIKEQEIESDLHQALTEIVEDLQKAGEYLQGWFQQLAAETREQLKKEFGRASSIFESEWFQNQLKISLENPVEKGSPLQKLLKLSDNTLKIVYEAGIHLQKEEDFLTARSVFRFLAFINPTVADFWICLGFCFCNLRNYQGASHSFNLAKEISPEEPDSFYFSAVNCTLQHQYEQADELCNQCLHLLNGHERLAQWQKPLGDLKQYIQSKKGGVSW
jgi:tetratricopeptide (TPR) repeat protein